MIEWLWGGVDLSQVGLVLGLVVVGSVLFNYLYRHYLRHHGW